MQIKSTALWNRQPLGFSLRVCGIRPNLLLFQPRLYMNHRNWGGASARLQTPTEDSLIAGIPTRPDMGR